LVKSIQDFPQMLEIRPIVVDEDNIVLGGNMRLKACKEAGLKEVYIVKAEGLTEEQKDEFIVKDNVGFGEWDWDMLANEWDAEKLDEWGLDLPVDLSVTELEAEEDDFSVPEGGIETDIVLGDLFEIGEHRLLCGDSTDSDQVAKLMNGEKADMVFTDPPYGMFLDADYSDMDNKFKGSKGGNKYDKIIGDNDDFTPELINTIFACFNDCKEIFIWGADYFAELLPNKNDGSWIVWDKRANGNDDIEEDKSSDKMYGSTFELCWSKQKHKREIARVKWAGIFGMEKEDTKKRVHPTQKPTKLAEWFFNKWGKPNDLIVDIFLGGGTTMVASHQLKRKCYGMELDPKYCQVIIDRMKKLYPSLVIKRNGETVK
jgi:site-specific DNA-methyltransferase (adenine-specific)